MNKPSLNDDIANVIDMANAMRGLIVWMRYDSRGRLESDDLDLAKRAHGRVTDLANYVAVISNTLAMQIERAAERDRRAEAKQKRVSIANPI